MGVTSTDVLLKTMVESAFADLRRNTWLLDDVFGNLAQDPLAKTDYGYKEVHAAKQWFLENQIDVYLINRVDNPRFPCITITQSSSVEKLDRASLSDEGFIGDIEPYAITKRIQRITEYFTPDKFDKAKGLITLPKAVINDQIVAGQYLISKKSGKAYVILHTIADDTVQIAANINDDFTEAYIAPPTSVWNLQQEETFLEESFGIGLHAQSDLNQSIWLRQLMIYVFLRYKEAYLERRGYELSTFQVGSIDENPNFQGVEKVYSCPLTLSGTSQVTWIKYAAPKLMGVRGGVVIADGPKTPEQYLALAKRQGWWMFGDQPQPPPEPPPEPQKDEE